MAGIGSPASRRDGCAVGEDRQGVPGSRSEIDEFVAQQRRWLRRVYTVLGGHALAAGGLTTFVAATGVRYGDTTAVAALAAAGAASVGSMERRWSR